MSSESSIGHYRITSKLGEGGMGAVYRATDTRLHREVAIKVIPEAFAQNPDRIARFTREAQVLASLNHPNIAAIYGVEEGALVMELVEGSTLEARIATGPIPIDEALAMVRQIADALGYAHERGIIHRDLKPANIKITPDDRVKVLDFGLAKALSGEPAGAADQTSSPTLTMDATSAGVIMGTAGYMSPEQARGKTVDKRTDIWAFGVVLLEMLTAAKVFKGETFSDTLAAVMRADVDYSRLPLSTPPEVRRLIGCCLERDPARRLRDIGDAGIVLEPPAGRDLAMPRPQRRHRWLPWAAGIASAILAAVATWSFLPKPNAEPVFFEIQAPKGSQVLSPAVSPDGHRIAFVVAEGSRGASIYVRRLDRTEITLLSGSENAISRPFWSPDGRRIGFFAGGRLKTVGVDGGNVQTVAEGLLGGRPSLSGAWSNSGVILFNHNGKPICRIPESGGAAIPVLTFDTTRSETGQTVADFLPDGKSFLYTSTSQRGQDIYKGSLDGSKPVLILESAAILGYARPPGASTGYLLFYQDGQIILTPYDPASGRVSVNRFTLSMDTRGTAMPMLGSFLATTTLGSISSGTVVLAKVFAERQMTWLARDGREVGLKGALAAVSAIGAGKVTDLQMSTDGRRMVFTRADATPDVWVADLERGSATRVTFSDGMVGSAVFSPDGARVAYASASPGQFKVLVRSSDGTGGTETLFEGQGRMQPASWSRDGRWLAVIKGEPGRWDIQLVAVGRNQKPVSLVATPFDEFQPQFSPDGRWIAYTSNESGRWETYVINVPESAGGDSRLHGRWQISTTGGQQPRWRGDGKELFFLSMEGQVMAVKIDASDHAFRATSPELLFAGAEAPIGPAFVYDVGADGRQFVVLKPVSGSTPPLRVVVNWAEAVVRR